MTNAFRLTLIGIVGCVLAFITAMNFLPASLVDGHYIPVGNDAFYHARRILDAVASSGPVYEFDPYIHYPEGSWIVWPWGYDYFMARIVEAGLWLFGAREPMTVLAYLPVLALPITIGLILAIASALRLSMLMRTLVVLSFGVSPLTQALHGVGAVDHHFVEHIFLLLTVLLGMLWMRNPRDARWAACLGITLGVAVAFHNGLFILQLPVLVALAVAWWRRLEIDRRSTALFAAGLVTATVLAALPSHAFRQGLFEFYVLSWFHVYVAFCTATVAVMLSRADYSRRSLILIAAIAVALAIPLATQAISGGSFVVARLDVLKNVDEIQSPLRLALDVDGAGRISRLYGLLVWLSPLLLVVSVLQIFRERSAAFILFWSASAFTLVLLMLQLRFFYFGSIALYIVPFWCLEQISIARPELRKGVVALSCLLMAVAIVPSVRLHLFKRPSAGLDPLYEVTRSMYPILASACSASPGLVLASSDQGHYVRYHTGCSVIANNFRLTPQHAAKIQEMERLYSLSPQELLSQAPQVRYIVVTMTGIYRRAPDGKLEPAPVEALVRSNPRLTIELLLTDVDQREPRLRKLFELKPDTKLKFPLMRLYEILPAAGSNGPSVSGFSRQRVELR